LVGWFGRLPGGHNCLRKLYARTDSGQEKRPFWKSRRTQAKDPLPLLKIAIRLNFKHKTPNCTIKKFVAHH